MGLLYPSETDEPFEVIRWTNGPAKANGSKSAKQGGHPASCEIEELSLDDFFEKLTQDGRLVR